MDYHITLFFHLNEIIMSREEALDKITKMLDVISLGDEISDPLAIIYIHAWKQWLEYAQFYLKIVQEDEVFFLQRLRPLSSSCCIIKCIEEKTCKSYNIATSSKMSSIKNHKI